MKLSREKIDQLFKDCYEPMSDWEKEEFAKFLFSHFYFLTCSIGDNDFDINQSAIQSFRDSFLKNMRSDGLEYIQRFFKRIVEIK